MKIPLSARVFALCTFLVAPAFAANAETLISGNFAPNAGPNLGAGVYGNNSIYWNTYNSDGKDPVTHQYNYTYDFDGGDLRDSAGNLTSVDIDFTGSAGGNTPNYNYTGFDPALFGHYLYTNSSNQNIDFSGLAAGGYDLILFSNNNTYSNPITFDVNGVAESLTPERETSFVTSPTGVGNYLSVDVVVGTNGNLDITNLNTHSGGTGLSGFQLETLPPSVPEPSALSMVLGGGLLLAFFLRRKLAANS